MVQTDGMSAEGSSRARRVYMPLPAYSSDTADSVTVHDIVRTGNLKLNEPEPSLPRASKDLRYLAGARDPYRCVAVAVTRALGVSISLLVDVAIKA